MRPLFKDSKFMCLKFGVRGWGLGGWGVGVQVLELRVRGLGLEFRSSGLWFQVEGSIPPRRV